MRQNPLAFYPPLSGLCGAKGGQIMAIIKGIWKALRGMSLLVILAVIFSGVLLVSCLARLFFGDGFSDVAGKLHAGS
jgi:hypothetical protein